MTTGRINQVSFLLSQIQICYTGNGKIFEISSLWTTRPLINSYTGNSTISCVKNLLMAGPGVNIRFREKKKAKGNLVDLASRHICFND